MLLGLGDRVLDRVVEPRVGEVALAAHLEVRLGAGEGPAEQDPRHLRIRIRHGHFGRIIGRRVRRDLLRRGAVFAVGLGLELGHEGFDLCSVGGVGAVI